MDAECLRPSVVLSADDAGRSFVVRTPQKQQLAWSKDELHNETMQTIQNLLNSVCRNPHRLLYAWTSRIFTMKAVRPLGGRTPEYRMYEGEAPDDLLDFIVGKSVEAPVNGRGRKRVLPGECLKYVIEELNEVLRMHHQNRKDELDNLVLSGITKAGHFENQSKLVIPPDLREGATGIPLNYALIQRETKASSTSDSRLSRSPTKRSLSSDEPIPSQYSQIAPRNPSIPPSIPPHMAYQYPYYPPYQISHNPYDPAYPPPGIPPSMYPYPPAPYPYGSPQPAGNPNPYPYGAWGHRGWPPTAPVGENLAAPSRQSDPLGVKHEEMLSPATSSSDSLRGVRSHKSMVGYPTDSAPLEGSMQPQRRVSASDDQQHRTRHYGDRHHPYGSYKGHGEPRRGDFDRYDQREWNDG
ncbi:hypothetical protein HDU97_001498 [Phlyctochytrium planicorne]|nr:hypothetical protein HDU97_001498 [Phlyctochytrium planicorne]